MERDWSSWPQEYYSTTDRDERKKLLQERLESGTADEKDQIRMKFWELRYKTRAKMPVGVDYFIRSWMNLCFVARKPGNKFQLKQQTEAIKEAKQDMGFELAAEYGESGEEGLYQELCHGVHLYMQICQEDGRYSTQLMGIMRLKKDHLVEKMGNELWKVSTLVPQTFKMEQEFALLKKACEDVFWKEYPKYVEDQEIKLDRK